MNTLGKFNGKGKRALVSIVMCTYNGSAYLHEQLQTILSQNYPAQEIIIVDDASSDNTWALLMEWQQQYPFIKLYRNNENLGFNKNFEKAISLAEGDYISIADQDDIWMPEKTELLLDALLANPAHTLAHCRSASLCKGEISYSNHRLHRHFSGNDTRKLVFFNHINGHGMMFKKELLQQALPVPRQMFYDWWIALIAATQGKIVSVDQTLVHHRIHEHNSFFTKNKKWNPRHDEIIDNILKIPTLATETRMFAQKLNSLIKEQIQKKKRLSFPLFLFMFKNRKVIFGHKKRAFPIFSYFKNSLKYAGPIYVNACILF